MKPLHILLSIPFPLRDAERDAILQVCPGATVDYVYGPMQEDLDALDGRHVQVLVSQWVPSSSQEWENLRFVQLLAAGINHIPPEHPIWERATVSTASGIHSVPMAQFGICALLMMVHQFPKLADFQRTKQWPDRTLLGGETLRGKTAGIIGYGSIGRECGRLAQSLGMRILAMDRFPDKQRDTGFNAWPGTGDSEGEIPEEWFSPQQLDEMLPFCDVLFITAPLTKATRGLLGAKELTLMKPTSRVIVLSRGGIVDETALCEALQSGLIAGASVDVYVTEPVPPNHPFFEVRNITLTPHISGTFDDYWEASFRLLVENLRRFTAGQPLLNVADGKRGF